MCQPSCYSEMSALDTLLCTGCIVCDMFVCIELCLQYITIYIRHTHTHTHAHRRVRTQCISDTHPRTHRVSSAASLRYVIAV